VCSIIIYSAPNLSIALIKTFPSAIAIIFLEVGTTSIPLCIVSSSSEIGSSLTPYSEVIEYSFVSKGRTKLDL